MKKNPCRVLWQRNQDSNLDNASQSRRCYRYTIPLYIKLEKSQDAVRPIITPAFKQVGAA